VLFPTIEFALFFLLVFTLSWAVRPWPVVRKVILLGASYVFYGYWDWRFAFLLFQCTMANYVIALWLDGLTEQRARKQVVVLGVALNLAVLGFFKYWGFFFSSFAELAMHLGFGRDLRIMEVLLPVGVSFFTFQGISYIVDVYRRDAKATTSIVDILLCISFFPHLVAGPLVRISEFVPQLAKPVDPSQIRAGRALLLIGLGLFKKVVIAHYLAVELVGPAFESPSSYSSGDLILAAYGYAVQIYCDFSAYTDIAIGIALLFGYQFPRNFDQPYRATSLRDFWHRWHITLSAFLRDYLYISLGGSRGGTLKTYRNLMVTMVLGGLWHGAAWNFVFWGFLHGAGLVGERLLVSLRQRLALPALVPVLAQALSIIAVFHFVCLTWIFFAADSFGIAWEYVTGIAKFQGSTQLFTPFVALLLGLGFVGQFVPKDAIERLERGMSELPLFIQAATLAFAVVAIGAIGPGTLAPFIYFRF
jgi:alginate O-acetyltransferase complex protein AlgI